MSGIKAAVVIFFISFPITLSAQALPNTAKSESTNQYASNSLKGKHGIELRLGLLSKLSSTNEISTGGITTKNKANGLGGSIAYNYWLEDNLALSISIGALNADANTSVSGGGTSVESAVVVPMLFGVKYQAFRFTDSNNLRPYVSASIGPYFGFASNVRAGAITSTESISETALGARLAVGMDLSLSKLFKLGFGAGYRFVTDFENRIGSETNYSSPEFSLLLGIVFGRGKK